MKSHVSKLLLTTSALMCVSASAHSASLVFDESTLPGQDFNNSLFTYLPHGVDGVMGVAAAFEWPDTDRVVLSGLPTGLNTVEYSFSRSGNTPDDSLWAWVVAGSHIVPGSV